MQLNKLDLNKLITGAKDDYEDNTEIIRELKHSKLIHQDVMTMIYSIAEFKTI